MSELQALFDGIQVSSSIAPFVIPAIMTGSQLLSGWLGGRNKQKQTTTNTGSQTNTGTSSSMPGWAPQFSPLQNALLPMITQKLLNPSALPAGYEQAGIRNINKTYDLAGQSLQNKLTSQGMAQSGSARAGTSGLEGGRASDIVQFQGTLPLVQRQMQQEDLGNAMNLFQMGRGVNTTGTNTGTSTNTGQTEAGGPGGFQGALGGLTDALGWMYGAGMLGGGGQQQGGGPTVGGAGQGGITPSSLPGQSSIPGIGPGTFPGWGGSMGMPGQRVGTGSLLPGESAGMPNSYWSQQSMFAPKKPGNLFGLPQQDAQGQQNWSSIPRTRF